MINKTREKLLRGEVTYGLALGLGSPRAAEVLSRVGADFIMIDAQHGTFGADSINATLMGIPAELSTPIVRVARNDYTLIGRLLDEGTLGIVVPMVHTAEDAKAAADACRFPPRGTRSYGWGRADVYGDDYADVANDQVIVMVQIESAEAVTNAEAILSIPGVDGCWVGPGDLSLSLGAKPSQAWTDERVQSALEKVLVACKNTGKAPGYAGGDADEGRRLVERGYRFITVGSDIGFLIEGAQATLTALRDDR
jgi:4-hydroxy-2-oxoheptanedioate aldolase